MVVWRDYAGAGRLGEEEHGAGEDIRAWVEGGARCRRRWGRHRGPLLKLFIFFSSLFSYFLVFAVARSAALAFARSAPLAYCAATARNTSCIVSRMPPYLVFVPPPF